MNTKIALACFSNLGHKRRLDIVKLLIKSAPGGLAMAEIAHKAAIPNSTLTHHILLLEKTGLVKRQQSAQSIHCQINIALLKALSQFLLDECCINAKATC